MTVAAGLVLMVVAGITLSSLYADYARKNIPSHGVMSTLPVAVNPPADNAIESEQYRRAGQSGEHARLPALQPSSYSRLPSDSPSVEEEPRPASVAIVDDVDVPEPPTPPEDFLPAVDTAQQRPTRTVVRPVHVGHGFAAPVSGAPFEGSFNAATPQHRLGAALSFGGTGGTGAPITGGARPAAAPSYAARVVGAEGAAGLGNAATTSFNSGRTAGGGGGGVISAGTSPFTLMKPTHGRLQNSYPQAVVLCCQIVVSLLHLRSSFQRPFSNPFCVFVVPCLFPFLAGSPLLAHPHFAATHQTAQLDSTGRSGLPTFTSPLRVT